MNINVLPECESTCLVPEPGCLFGTTIHQIMPILWIEYLPDTSVMERKLVRRVARHICKANKPWGFYFLGYMYFQHPKSLNPLRRKLPGVHLEPARGSFLQNKNYCSKDGDFYESGDPPSDDGDRGNAEIARWNTARIAAQEGRLDDVPSDIYIRCYNTIKCIAKDHMPRVQGLDAFPGIWIFGLSGCGKSRSCFEQLPDAYWKPRNLWWDGYQGEKEVVIDDFDKFDVKLGGVLKHWADYYPFICENKGSSMRIRPELLVVTSQYRIEDIWTDAETQSALLRRFKVVEKIAGQNIIIKLYLSKFSNCGQVANPTIIFSLDIPVCPGNVEICVECSLSASLDTNSGSIGSIPNPNYFCL